MLQNEELQENRTGSISGDGYEFSQEVDKIIPAFVKMQGELEPAKLLSNNPFFNSKYSDLNEVMRVLKKPLSDNGFAVAWFVSMMPYVDCQLKEQELKQFNGRNGTYEKLIWTGKWNSIRVREIKVTTLLLHTSGQYIKAWIILIPNDNDNQTKGKCITYGKRYSITSLTGLCSEEDNDGNPEPKNKSYEGNNNQLPPPKKEEKPKQNNTDNYICDEKGNRRYDKNKQTLFDKYQIKNTLIINAQWKTMLDLIMQNCGGDSKKFTSWLKDVYNVKFYDIKQSMIAGIMETLTNSSEQIFLD